MTQMQLKKVRKSKKGETIVEVLPNNVKDNPNETDAQIIERMRERFNILDDMTQASIDGVVRGKIKDHLAAIMSRCHYLDLTMDTMREKVLRCKQIVADGMLNEYQFTQEEQDDLMNFMFENKEKMREISLRMVTKLADLKKSFGTDKWKRTAEVTCMRRV